MDLGDLRRDYARSSLDRAGLAPDPMDQFAAWFEEARAQETGEPNAMTLATADAAGQPNARIVLLKSVDRNGFVFFTDYRSRKGRELEANPRVALCFHWATLQRQVRINGVVSRLDREAAAAYYRTRPRGSRLGAWASRQSEVLSSRDSLEAEVARLDVAYPGEEIPLPPHWGGYVVVPHEIEFWQGRSDRLHDRFQYTQTESGWNCARLSP
ncbi:MAG TPA: pyridoxamine 5'-phosphate oxidase [Gemmatimonadales bacterium]|nr:pyridoxamine 5'-phosphate oxidase [Gemmatimonadales bacterium]